MRRVLSVGLPLLTLGACFSYVPAAPGMLRQGQGVNVFLSAPQDVKLREVTANNVVRVQGEVIEADTQQLAVSASLLVSSSGYEQLGEGATVVIPRASVQQLTARRVSVVRSIGLAGSALVLAALARGSITGGSRDGGGPPPSGQ